MTDQQQQQQHRNISSSGSKAQQQQRGPSTSSSQQQQPFLFEDFDGSLVLPLLAPRIYPYTPTVTTRTPIRITATQFRDRRSGTFVQDRWKVYALDDVLSKLPASFLKLAMKKSSSLHVRHVPKSSSSQRKNYFDAASDMEDDDENDDGQEDGPTRFEKMMASDPNFLAKHFPDLDGILPKTVEFQSRKSSQSTNNVQLPHLTVTAARDGTMFVKSVPKRSKKDKKRHHRHNSKTEQQQETDGDDTQASSSKSSSQQQQEHSSYGQIVTQLLHADVVPMSILYRVEGGVGSFSAPAFANAVQEGPWHFVDVTCGLAGDGVPVADQTHHQHRRSPSRNHNTNNNNISTGAAAASSSSWQQFYDNAGGTPIFLPLGRVCVLAKTRDDVHRRAGVEPSWSSVYTVSASNRDDATDYSKSAALHFAGI